MSYTYEYPRASTTLDAAIIRIPDLISPEILLIKRKNPPFMNKWALPGGFLEMNEEPLEGAKRELEEETSLFDIPLKPVFTCGQTGRDPRGRCITMVFGCLLLNVKVHAKAGDDAAEVGWFKLDGLPELAFDHQRIIKQLYESIKWQAKTSIIGQDVFAESFSEKDINTLNCSFAKNITAFQVKKALELGIISKNLNDSYSFIRRKNDGPDWVERVW